MSSITKKQVMQVAHLCKLQLSEEEIIKYTKDLSKMIEIIETVDEVELDNEPMTHIHEGLNELRKDIVGETLDINDVLKNAPSSEDNYFIV